MAQIDLNDVSEKQKKEKKEKQSKSDSLKVTSIYAISNWSMTHRYLRENEGLFAEPLGVRAGETWKSSFSYALGVQNQINHFLFWDGGFGFATNGEKLVQEATDTAITTLRTFRYFAMPLRINAYFGKKVRFSGGVGLSPQLFFNSSEKETEHILSSGKEEETITKIKNGNSTFVLSALFNVGVKVEVAKDFSLWFSPEYRLHLNSSYGETQPYIHKGFGIGVNFGLLLTL